MQLPVPKHIDADKVIRAISPEKDVDGFHPMNVGRLVIGEKGFVSCTPAGIIQLLKRSGIEISGKNCVIIGRSNIVGKPMALLMLQENATVTVAHSKTTDLKAVCKTADILIVAIGKKQFITADYIKEGAVVIVSASTEERTRSSSEMSAMRKWNQSLPLSPLYLVV